MNPRFKSQLTKNEYESEYNRYREAIKLSLEAILYQDRYHYVSDRTAQRSYSVQRFPTYECDCPDFTGVQELNVMRNTGRRDFSWSQANVGRQPCKHILATKIHRNEDISADFALPQYLLSKPRIAPTGQCPCDCCNRGLNPCDITSLVVPTRRTRQTEQTEPTYPTQRTRRTRRNRPPELDRPDRDPDLDPNPDPDPDNDPPTPPGCITVIPKACPAGAVLTAPQCFQGRLMQLVYTGKSQIVLGANGICREECLTEWRVIEGSGTCQDPEPNWNCPKVDRYIAWTTDPNSYFFSGSTLTAAESFTCDDGTVWTLIAHSGPYISGFIDIGGGQTEYFGPYGPFCPYTENVLERPVCTPQTWYCSGGVCYQGEGPYATQAECEAALIPPPFTGGQCSARYNVVWKWYDRNADNSFRGAERTLNTGATGPIRAFKFIRIGSSELYEMAIDDARGDNILTGQTAESYGSLPPFTTSITLTRQDGQPDDCGNLPYTCP